MLRCKNISKNSGWYNVSDGAVFTENYNETLDSGTILLQQLTSEIDIEPYDVFMIESYENGLTINTRYLCVDNYSKIITSLKPLIYKYEISLFSLTKILEGYLCPNLAITKVGDTKYIKDYILRYVKLYAPKSDSADDIGAVNQIIEVSQDVIDYFNVECPEMQWNEPTLREVLNDLMMVRDCIPVITYNNGFILNKLDISLIDNTEPDLSGINYIHETQSSEDYISGLKMHLYNTANNKSSYSTDASRIVEKIGFRNDESYLLTTDNMRLQTSLPIWRFFSLKCQAVINTRVYYWLNAQQLYEDVLLEYEVDLSDYLLEYSDWKTKDVYYGTWGNFMELNPDYRNTCLYYIRGQKNVYNFNDKQENTSLFIQQNAFVINLIVSKLSAEVNSGVVAREWFEEDSGLSGEFLNATSVQLPYFKEMTFQFAYEPIDECVFVASKEGIPNHIREVVDNQTNSYIDVNRTGILEYLKAKRLGNKLAMVNGRYFTDESLMPSLSQVINDKIIFKKEIEVYNNYIDVNYTTVENYVLKDYFTSVKSKLRSWKIVSGAEAVKRAELIKIYANSHIDSIENNDLIMPMYSTTASYLTMFRYCAIRFYDKNNNYYPVNTTYYDKTSNSDISINTNAIAVEFSKHTLGNSVVFTIDMSDNFYAGNYVSAYEGKDTSGSILLKQAEQKGIKYTDSNGEIVGGEIYFYDVYEDLDFINDYNNSIASRGLKPLVNIGLTKTGQYETPNGLNLSSRYLVAKLPFKLYKDSKEILQISVQIEINNDANDMFIGFNKNRG